MKDPDLISLRAEIALLDGRVGQLFERMTKLESDTAFEQIKDCIYAMEAAIIEDRIDDAMNYLKDAKKAFKAASAERDGWNEIYGIVKERRQMVDAERKREETLQGNMTARQVGTFIAAVQTAIMEEVHDTDVRKRLALRLQFLLGMQEGSMNTQRFPGYEAADQKLVNIDRTQFILGPPQGE